MHQDEWPRDKAHLSRRDLPASCGAGRLANLQRFVSNRLMKRVLVVDDSDTMRRMVIAALTSIGDLTFEQAVSGLDAIERVTVAPVDLVLLDINMPDMH